MPKMSRIPNAKRVYYVAIREPRRKAEFIDKITAFSESGIRKNLMPLARRNEGKELRIYNTNGELVALFWKGSERDAYSRNYYWMPLVGNYTCEEYNASGVLIGHIYGLGKITPFPSWTFKNGKSDGGLKGKSELGRLR